MSMTVEERLKELILARYNSMREFALVTGIANSTLDSMVKRGVLNSSVNNVIKVCNALQISADALADGEIIFIENTKEESDDQDTEEEISLDVIDIIENTKRQLLAYDGLMFNGQPADKDSIDSILNAMEIGIEMAKRNRK